MRIAIVLVASLLLAIAGLIVHKETQRRDARATTGGVGASDAPVATLTTGERVDVDAGVPRAGITVVMFTADF